MTSLKEFTYLFGRAVFEKLLPRQRRLMTRFMQMLKSLSGKPGIDPATGLPTFSLEVGDISQPDVTLREIFLCLEKADQPCWVAIDEFQQIGTYAEENVEALLRSHMQQTTNCRFVFAGSERHLLSEMFLSSARPFYNSADLMELKPIPEKIYSDFVVRLMTERHRCVEADLIGRIYRLFDGNTYFLQQTFHKAFAATPCSGACTEDRVQEAIDGILDVREFQAKEVLSQLSPVQKALLYAVAIDGAGCQITSAAFVQRHSLGAASSVQGAARALLANGILTKSEKTYRVSDQFFRLWLLRYFNRRIEW